MKKKEFQFSNLYLIIMLCLMYLPILVIIVFSFNQSKLPNEWDGFSLDWYRQLFRDRSMVEALRNTLVLGFLSSGAAAIIGTLGAVGMRKSTLPGRGAVEYIALLPMMTPEIIMGMVSLTFFSLLSLPFGMLTLFIAHTAFCIPYVYMQVKARLVGLDPSFLEAARDLGASESRAFFDVTLPLIAPAIVSGTLLAFAMSIDDVIISVFVTGANTNTLPIKIYTMLKTGVTPKINALCTLMFGATLLIVIASVLIGRRKPRLSDSQ